MCKLRYLLGFGKAFCMLVLKSTELCAVWVSQLVQLHQFCPSHWNSFNRAMELLAVQFQLVWNRAFQLLWWHACHLGLLHPFSVSVSVHGDTLFQSEPPNKQICYPRVDIFPLPFTALFEQLGAEQCWESERWEEQILGCGTETKVSLPLALNVFSAELPCNRDPISCFQCCWMLLSKSPLLASLLTFSCSAPSNCLFQRSSVFHFTSFRLWLELLLSPLCLHLWL